MAKQNRRLASGGEAMTADLFLAGIIIVCVAGIWLTFGDE